MNCQGDLTAVDLEHATSGALSSASTSSSSSLLQLVDFHRSHAQNIANADDADALKRVIRGLDSRNTVLTNDEIVGTAQEGDALAGGVWTAGSIETQDDDDELLVHVRAVPTSPCLTLFPLTSSRGGAPPRC